MKFSVIFVSTRKYRSTKIFKKSLLDAVYLILNFLHLTRMCEDVRYSFSVSEWTKRVFFFFLFFFLGGGGGGGVVNHFQIKLIS